MTTQTQVPATHVHQVNMQLTICEQQRVAFAARLISKAEALSDELAQIVNEVAAVEGAHEVWRTAAQSLGQPEDRLSVIAVGYLKRSLDDTWSGRRNDARRARFEGQQNAAIRLLDIVTL